MPKRRTKDATKEKNRKWRKLRWIRARNYMRKYPECAYNGDFYCNHVYDPEHPWQWVDFRFFHTTQKKYFSVAMTTTKYDAAQRIYEESYNLADFPPFPSPMFVKCEQDSNFKILNTGSDEYRKLYQQAASRRKKIEAQLSQSPVIITPKIELHDYGDVAVGVHTTVNVDFIDEHFIRKFITFFRSLGQPIKPGWKWKGEPVSIMHQPSENAV